MLRPEVHLPDIVLRHREKTFNIGAEKPLRNQDQAVRYVNQRGFIFFWPNKEYEFPSLWTAVAGNRPVADNHDDPAHITWRWKDNLLGKNRWYYAKIIRQRSTIISLELLPYFYALSPNYGNPQEDYLLSYQDGELSSEEKSIYESLLEHGALDTITLRESANLSSSEGSTRFNRALNLLQRDYRILPVGISERGAWHYSFIYDLTHRQFPHLPDQSRSIRETEAVERILTSYLVSLGAANFHQIRKFFQWPESKLRKALDKLIMSGDVIPGGVFADAQEEWFTIKQLFE